MGDFLKQVFEAANQRLKSPFLGFFLLAFASFNYAALMVLFWGEGSIDARVRNFQLAEKSFLFPVVIGILGPLVTPWLNWGAGIVIAYPRKMLREVEAQNAGAAEYARLKEEEKNAELKRSIASSDAEVERLRRQEIEDRTKRLELQGNEDTGSEQEGQKIEEPSSDHSDVDASPDQSGSISSEAPELAEPLDKDDEFEHFQQILASYGAENFNKIILDFPTSFAGKAVRLIDTSSKDGASYLIDAPKEKSHDMPLSLSNHEIFEELLAKLGIWSDYGNGRFRVSETLISTKTLHGGP